MVCACPSGKLVDCTYSFVSQTDSLSSLPRCTKVTHVLRAILVSNTWRNWPNVNVRSPLTPSLASFQDSRMWADNVPEPGNGTTSLPDSFPGSLSRVWEWDWDTPSLIPRLCSRVWEWDCTTPCPETMCVIFFHRLCNYLPPQVHRLPP